MIRFLLTALLLAPPLSAQVASVKTSVPVFTGVPGVASFQAPAFSPALNSGLSSPALATGLTPSLSPTLAPALIPILPAPAVPVQGAQAITPLQSAVRTFGDGFRAIPSALAGLFDGAASVGEPAGPAVSAGVAVRAIESIGELKVGSYNVLNFFMKVGKHVPDPDNPGRLKKVSDAQPKPEWALREQGRIILENDLDIVTLAEVENIAALEDFNARYLGGAYRVYLIEGNDQRGIDIAFLVKKDLPFVIEQRSHKGETWDDPVLGGGPKTLFSRDLTALVVRAQGKAQPLFVLFGTHYKSKRDRDSRDPESTILRTAQVRRSAEIIARYRKEFGPEVPIMIAGDFNGSVGREAAFDPLFKVAGLTDSFDVSPNPPSDLDRITHTSHPRGGAARSAQMDAVLVSKGLRAAVKRARVYRYKNPDGTVRPIPKTYEEREKNPSDHFPVIVTLDFAPIWLAAADREMARLNTAGYAVLPPDSLMSPATERRVLEAVYNHPQWNEFLQRASARNLHIVLGQIGPDGFVNLGANPDGSGGIKEFVANLDGALRRALPNEDLVLTELFIRFTKDDRPVSGSNVHVDVGESHITLTYALEGPGTVIYDDSDPHEIKEIRTPPRTASIVTNTARSQATGIVGTVHSAPNEIVFTRVLLIIRYSARKPTAVTKEEAAAHMDGQNRRVLAVDRFIRR